MLLFCSKERKEMTGARKKSSVRQELIDEGFFLHLECSRHFHGCFITGQRMLAPFFVVVVLLKSYTFAEKPAC